ncbi:MAG TPA: hypothetical protein VFU37_22820 [Pyrinomonadaceae bacterium]|nr:hypothetical protein [Pyrinomonadaceae bacterium]
MSNDEGSPNAQMTEGAGAFLFHHSDFVIPSAFFIRASSFSSSGLLIFHLVSPYDEI